MSSPPRLAHRLRTASAEPDLVAVLDALAGGIADLADRVRRGAGSLGETAAGLDGTAHEILLGALAATPTALVASEEADDVVVLDEGGAFAVAADPLTGGSHLPADIPAGVVFAVFDRYPGPPETSFLRPGREMRAAGYAVMGPRTDLVVGLGGAPDLYRLSPDDGAFRLAHAGLRIPEHTSEFAVNTSNYRHWAPPIRTFIDDCVEGTDGPRAKDFTMRWTASLVAETHRIFTRGGVFLYPADSRPGYGHGRTRLLYEAAPIAFLAEGAGGKATDGASRILDRVPTRIHQDTPLVFGSAAKVDRIARYHTDPDLAADSSPLFGQRGLFRT